MTDISPGWYKDPAEPTTQRYWDGEGWLGDPLPIEATPPPGPPPVAPAPPTAATDRTTPGPGSGTGEPDAGGPDAAFPPMPPGTAFPPPRAFPPVGGLPPGTSHPPGSASPGGPYPPAQPRPDDPSGAVIPPGVFVPPGAIIMPGTVLPPGTVPPPGAVLPGAILAPGPVPPGAARSPGAVLPPGASLPPGALLPPGTQPPGVPPAGGPPLGAVPPGAVLPPIALPPGWRPGMPLPVGAVLRPGAQIVARPLPHGLPMAPLGLRFLARLIDIAVVLALNVIGNGWLAYRYVSDVMPLAKAFARQLQTNESGPLPPAPAEAGWLYMAILLVTTALWFVYEVPATAQTGQTWGKRVVGIKVMALESEAPLGMARAMRRWNPLGLPVLLWSCGLGYLLQLVDSLSPCLEWRLHLALHDRYAHTVVVRTGRRGHEITPVRIPEGTGDK